MPRPILRAGLHCSNQIICRSYRDRPPLQRAFGGRGGGRPLAEIGLARIGGGVGRLRHGLTGALRAAEQHFEEVLCCGGCGERRRGERDAQEQKPRPALRRRFLTALRDIVIILLVTIASLEVGLRIFHHFRPLPIFYDNSYNRFRTRPHMPIYDFHTNSKGFHDVERTQEKPAGTYRALRLGNSFSFGIVPHQFNYLTLLESRIKSVRPGFELINMGISGISPREYLAVLLHEGLKLRPDMVLLSFFIGNDFAETAKIDQIDRLSYVANIAKYVYALGTSVGNLGGATASAYKDDAPSLTDGAFLQISPLASLFSRKTIRYSTKPFPTRWRIFSPSKRSAICTAFGCPLF